MWDFARDAAELRRFVPGLPISAQRYERLVSAVAVLDKASSVDEIVRLTLPRLARARGRPRLLQHRVGDPRHLRAHLGLGLGHGRRTITRVAPASCKRRSRSRSAGCPYTEIVMCDGSRPASFARPIEGRALSRSSPGVMRFGSQPSPHATDSLQHVLRAAAEQHRRNGASAALRNDFTGGKS